MSVYSGFATRKQEEYYNKLVSKLLQLLSQKILSSPDASLFFKDNVNVRLNTENESGGNYHDGSVYSGLNDLSDGSILEQSQRSNSAAVNRSFGMKIEDEKWAKYIAKIYKSLAIMERIKYLEPHFSQFIAPLAKYCVQRFKIQSGNKSKYSQLEINESSIMDAIIEEEIEDKDKRSPPKRNRDPQVLASGSLKEQRNSHIYQKRKSPEVVLFNNEKTYHSDEKQPQPAYLRTHHEIPYQNNNAISRLNNLIQSRQSERSSKSSQPMIQRPKTCNNHVENIDISPRGQDMTHKIHKNNNIYMGVQQSYQSYKTQGSEKRLPHDNISVSNPTSVIINMKNNNDRFHLKKQNKENYSKKGRNNINRLIFNPQAQQPQTLTSSHNPTEQLQSKKFIKDKQLPHRIDISKIYESQQQQQQENNNESNSRIQTISHKKKPIKFVGGHKARNIMRLLLNQQSSTYLTKENSVYEQSTQRTIASGQVHEFSVVNVDGNASVTRHYDKSSR